MVGDETVSSEQNYPANNAGEEVINVPFPYSEMPLIDDSLTYTAAPSLKIDYTAIEIPPPKKTITVRRSVSETRLVHLEKSLKEGHAEPKSPTAASPGTEKKVTRVVKNDELSDTIQKLLKSVGSISLATQENQRQYANIASSLEKQSTALPKLDALQKHLDQSHKVETANQRLFDVMHSELKGYKDNFLFDALQKPVIRDLLALFDDLCGQARRLSRFLNEHAETEDSQIGWKAELKASHDNINNTIFFIVEVLNRLDVTIVDEKCPVLDLKLHKVVGVEETHDIEEKNHIARVVRPGFMWKERVLRPTEVILKKYSAAPADVQ